MQLVMFKDGNGFVDVPRNLRFALAETNVEPDHAVLSRELVAVGTQRHALVVVTHRSHRRSHQTAGRIRRCVEHCTITKTTVCPV